MNQNYNNACTQDPLAYNPPLGKGLIEVMQERIDYLSKRVEALEGQVAYLNRANLPVGVAAPIAPAKTPDASRGSAG